MADKIPPDLPEMSSSPNISHSGNIPVFNRQPAYFTLSALRPSLSSQSSQNKSHELNCQIDIMSQIESYEGETSSLMDSPR